MTRVAALDCGTNSLRLLVADVEPSPGGAGGRLSDVARQMEIVRLGQGVDRTGRLAPEALARTFAALRRYSRIVTTTGAAAVRMVATSATRDAANAGEFASGVRAVLGIDPEVIGGDEEAALSFSGATTELAAAGVPAPYLVVDIGGGSTEFVFGAGTCGRPGTPASGATPGAAIAASVSADIGCVRMTERHLHGDPPAAAEIAAAAADIDAAVEVAAARLPNAATATLVGLAGSVTTVAGIALNLPSYDTSRIHHAKIPAEQVHTVARRLLASSHAQRAGIGVMHPGRVDVIGAGALILSRIMTRFGFTDVLASEHDILDGIAWSLAAQAGENGRAALPGAPRPGYRGPRSPAQRTDDVSGRSP